MPRLLILTPYGGVSGGAEQWLLGILSEPALTTAGWNVDAIVMQNGPLTAALRAQHVAAITMPIPASPAAICARVPSLRRSILLRCPDVVVANGVKAQLAAALALTRTGIPTVWVKHDHSYDRPLAKPLGRRATLVVPTAMEVGEPTGRADAIVIEPPRPPQPWPADAATQALRDRGWRPSRRLAVGMITRLVPYKGVDMAIEALADPATDDWELVVIGGDDPATPDESDRLRALASALGVGQRVFFAGEIAGAGRLLTAVDAAAVLTRPGQAGAPEKEGYGIVASEAMLAGIPVIVAQPGPISRRLTTPEGPAGITLSAPTSGQFASALATLAHDGLRQEMGSRGIRVAGALPTQADIAWQFVNVLSMAGEHQ